jgi:hypothetical protein
MNYPPGRRLFLKTTVAAGAGVGLGELSFLSRLPIVSNVEACSDINAVRFRPEIEPIVRMLEETARARLLEEVAARIKRGLSYQELLAGLLLAGVRNIQPRPVGFKFHAVLVVNSAHLASLASPKSERWVPIFWALDHFKESQARDEKEGDWTMAPVKESAAPPDSKAQEQFIRAMENWDESAADASVAGLVRSAKPQEIFEIFCRFGARDFRDIGHKAIYVANSWRTLQQIGWQHAEPVLRSLAYALLYHEGTNPAERDAVADRPWRRNLKLVERIREKLQPGTQREAVLGDMLATLRQGTHEEASYEVVKQLNHGIAPQTIWDALFLGAGELLMRKPGITSLHAVTTTNALHFAYQTSNVDETRKLLLMQNAAFLTLFRGESARGGEIKIDQFEAVSPQQKGQRAVEEIFAEINTDRVLAARKMLGGLKQNLPSETLIESARRLVSFKGNNSHDYKFSSAAMEDYHHISPAWRDRFLASSIFNLRGSAEPDNVLVNRIREALK